MPVMMVLMDDVEHGGSVRVWEEKASIIRDGAKTFARGPLCLWGSDH